VDTEAAVGRSVGGSGAAPRAGYPRISVK
jgi:hypothetical protein